MGLACDGADVSAILCYEIEIGNTSASAELVEVAEAVGMAWAVNAAEVRANVFAGPRKRRTQKLTLCAKMFHVKHLFE